MTALDRVRRECHQVYVPTGKHSHDQRPDVSHVLDLRSAAFTCSYVAIHAVLRTSYSIAERMYRQKVTGQILRHKYATPDTKNGLRKSTRQCRQNRIHNLATN